MKCFSLHTFATQHLCRWRDKARRSEYHMAERFVRAHAAFLLHELYYLLLSATRVRHRYISYHPSLRHIYPFPVCFCSRSSFCPLFSRYLLLTFPQQPPFVSHLLFPRFCAYSRILLHFFANFAINQRTPYDAVNDTQHLYHH